MLVGNILIFAIVIFVITVLDTSTLMLDKNTDRLLYYESSDATAEGAETPPTDSIDRQGEQSEDEIDVEIDGLLEKYEAEEMERPEPVERPESARPESSRGNQVTMNDFSTPQAMKVDENKVSAKSTDISAQIEAQRQADLSKQASVGSLRNQHRTEIPRDFENTMDDFDTSPKTGADMATLYKSLQQSNY